MKNTARFIRQQTVVIVCFLTFIFALCLSISFAKIDADDIHEIEAADCQELAVAFKEFNAMEKTPPLTSAGSDCRKLKSDRAKI